MKTRVLAAAFFAAALSGCVIHDHQTGNPPPAAGNVSFLWTFSDGNTCGSLNGEVDHIHIDIAGQVLDNNGNFSCAPLGTQGVQLNNFDPGTYSFTVTAVDGFNQALYQGSGGFTVNGDIGVSVTLSPAVPPTGDINLLWGLPSGQSCASLGIAYFQVSIPGDTVPNNGHFSCSEYPGGVMLNDYNAGGYTIQVSAYDVFNNLLSSGSGQVNVPGGGTGTVTVDLGVSAQPQLTLTWSFAGQSCAQAGVSSVWVVFNGDLQNAQTVNCNDGTADEAVFDISAGTTYSIHVAALDANQTILFNADTSTTTSNGNTSLNIPFADTTWELTYNFANSQSCAVSGIATVSLSVVDRQWTGEVSGLGNSARVNCSDTSPELSYDPFSGDGAVSVQLYGYDASGARVAGATRSISIQVGADNATTITLEPCGTANAGC